jgi:uncharacterized protein (TIGR03067 family)
MRNWYRWTFLMLAGLSAAGCSRTHSEAPAVQGQALAAPIDANELARNDLKQFQGAWRIERLVWDGVSDPNAGDGVTYLFEGEKFIMLDRDGNRQEETIKLLPGQTPKAIDCWGEAGRAVPGIYSLESDTLTWCAAGGSDKQRPTAFESTPGSRQSLMVFRRERG